MKDSELKQWQKLIIGEISNEEFHEFIRNRFQYLAKSVNQYGFWDTIERINPNDYPDPEFQKLVKYYIESRELLRKYILKKAENPDR